MAVQMATATKLRNNKTKLKIVYDTKTSYTILFFANPQIY